MNQPVHIELPTQFMGTVNCFLFKDPEPVLIDCGDKTKGAWEKLVASLKAEGLRLQDIKKVIITHAHVDHMGMSKRIVEASGAKIWVSEITYDWAWNLKAKWKERGNIFRNTLKMTEDPA